MLLLSSDPDVVAAPSARDDDVGSDFVEFDCVRLFGFFVRWLGFKHFAYNLVSGEGLPAAHERYALVGEACLPSIAHRGGGGIHALQVGRNARIDANELVELARGV